MKLLALLALALVTCGCVVYQCPPRASTEGAIKLDRSSDYIEVNCPPTDTHFAGTCTDGCNTWSCDGSGTCSVTSLYCPKDGLWITP